MVSDGPTSVRSDRVRAVRRLWKKSGRMKSGRFVVEGMQGVREALAAGVVEQLYSVEPMEGATIVSSEVLSAMSETVTPQGVVAVCRMLEFTAPVEPRLVVILHDVRDPGNAGTILRTADAAGADAVYFTGDSVDPYNGKCVRATAGSLFHIPFASCPLDEVPLAGLQVLATSGAGDADLREVDLSVPTAWVFGNEAHGLPDLGFPTVSIPIFGAAESLNLASAAAVCLYASALRQ
jgi:TrmH family RNA methyltransferase